MEKSAKTVREITGKSVELAYRSGALARKEVPVHTVEPNRELRKQAVLLLAHGTPETVDQIPEYLRNVVGGRPLPQPVVEEIQHRYSQIGRSPLTAITLEQGRLVEADLAAGGAPVPVYVAMRNWRPYIPDVVLQMRADGVQEAAVICMAPQNSRTSVGLYRRAVEAEAGNAAACASTSLKAGRSIRSSSRPLPSASGQPWPA